MPDIPENADPIDAPPALPTIDAPTLEPVPRPAWGEENTAPETPTTASTPASAPVTITDPMFAMRSA